MEQTRVDIWGLSSFLARTLTKKLPRLSKQRIAIRSDQPDELTGLLFRNPALPCNRLRQCVQRLRASMVFIIIGHGDDPSHTGTNLRVLGLFLNRVAKGSFDGREAALRQERQA